MQKTTLKLLTKICILFVLLAGLFIYLKKDQTGLDYYTQKIYQTCSKSSYRPGCYDQEIPKLLEKNLLTFEQSFELTKKIQQLDREYLYCHVLGHNLADIETKKDLSRWQEVVARCPALTCNNGCPHGAIMRRFKGQEFLTSAQITEIIPELQSVCESRQNWQPSEMEKAMCYHSLGHTAMYLTNGNLNSSLDLCQKVSLKDDGRSYYQTCVQGVFMIVYQSLDPEDEALVKKIKPLPNQVATFCSKFSGLEKVACLTESWPLFFQDLQEPAGLVRFCSSFPNSSYYRQWCLDTGLNSLSVQKLQQAGYDSMYTYCLGLPSADQKHCFASIAATWVQIEPNYAPDAIGLCELANQKKLGDLCFDNLLYFSSFGFTPHTPDWEKYCRTFPESYSQKCLNGDIPKTPPTIK